MFRRQEQMSEPPEDQSARTALENLPRPCSPVNVQEGCHKYSIQICAIKSILKQTSSSHFFLIFRNLVEA